jgi:uncharacterized protein
MIIDLSSIGTTVKRIEVAFDPTEIDLDAEDAILTGRAEFSGETERVGGKAHVRGTVAADVTLDCTRCLEPVSRHLDVSFDDIFVDSRDEPDADEIEVGEDELAESLALDGKIDMAEVVREQILLAVPEQIFCSDDCKGLCSKCGANLNLIDCMCADDDIDPRWAALKSLK